MNALNVCETRSFAIHFGQSDKERMKKGMNCRAIVIQTIDRLNTRLANSLQTEIKQDGFTNKRKRNHHYSDVFIV